MNPPTPPTPSPRSTQSRKAVFGAAVIVFALLAGVARAQQVTVRPVETDELLANPGVGAVTFGYPRNSPVLRNMPAWMPSTVHYNRWGWGVLEPQPGKIDHEFLDKLLRESRASGQKYAFGIMCCDPSGKRDSPLHRHPLWLKEVGGKEIQADYLKNPCVIPDMDDPVVLARHVDFIKRLGERYDGHPDLESVDIGSVGWWGEWHMTGSTNEQVRMPTKENCTRIIDAYLAAFKKTPLLMSMLTPASGAYGGGQTGPWKRVPKVEECTAYATQRGTGWRANALGHVPPGRGGHMRSLYPPSIKSADIRDAWKSAPVFWETYSGYASWVKESLPVRWILNYALATHASHINLNGDSDMKSFPKEPGFLSEMERFLRRLGYRLVLKELAHPDQIKAGDALTISMKWQNVGSAPCYKPYRLAYRLTNASGRSEVFVGKLTVNRWMPGSIELFTEEFFKEVKDLPPGEVAAFSDTIAVPGNMPVGTYGLSVAVVGEQTTTPVVRLGIKGRDDGGWYPLSKVQIAK